MKIEYKLHHSCGAQGYTPIRNYPDDACHDLLLPEDITIQPGECKHVNLLIAFHIPPGWHIMMYSRSSTMLKHGILVQDSVIDEGYRGCVHAILFNPTSKPVSIKAETRIVQIKAEETQNPAFVEVDDLPPSVRDTKGCGSTGI